jgi:hypothetical protein
VWIWVRREAESLFVGGGERFMWGIQGLKTWWREKERRKELAANWGMTGFFTDFGPNFLHTQAMKSTFIYRRWKTVILSIQGKYFSPWFNLKGSQLLVQSRHHELSNLTVQGCLR